MAEHQIGVNLGKRMIDVSEKVAEKAKFRQDSADNTANKMVKQKIINFLIVHPPYSQGIKNSPVLIQKVYQNGGNDVFALSSQSMISF